jgi:hypothetical protein
MLLLLLLRMLQRLVERVHVMGGAASLLLLNPY